MNRELAEIRRLHKVKTRPARAGDPLGAVMIDFFKNSVARRQTKLAKIAERWQEVVPPMFSEHCALESLSRGVLTVILDSASHLYELKQLFLAGLEQQILISCKSTGLRKIQLKRGRWYDGKGPEDRRIQFDSEA